MSTIVLKLEGRLLCLIANSKRTQIWKLKGNCMYPCLSTNMKPCTDSTSTWQTRQFSNLPAESTPNDGIWTTTACCTRLTRHHSQRGGNFLEYVICIRPFMDLLISQTHLCFSSRKTYCPATQASPIYSCTTMDPHKCITSLTSAIGETQIFGL